MPVIDRQTDRQTDRESEKATVCTEKNDKNYFFFLKSMYVVNTSIESEG